MTLSVSYCVFRFPFLHRIFYHCYHLREQKEHRGGLSLSLMGWSNSKSFSVLTTTNLAYKLKKEFKTKSEEEDNSAGEALVRSILGVGYGQARIIVNKFPDFNTSAAQDLLRTLKYLVDKKGVSLDRILRNPWLLFLQPAVLEQRLQTVLELIPINSVQIALPFVSMHVNKLTEIRYLWKWEAKHEQSLVIGKFPTRIEYLAKHLECSEMAVADFLVRVKRLSTLPFNTLETILQILLEGGVKPLDIEEDPWIFTHNINVMTERLADAHRRGLPQIKPWMLRCNLAKYESHVTRAIKENTIKPSEENMDSFIQRKLNCSTVCVKDILSSIPSIQVRKASKLDSMISLLLQKGYTADDIAHCPRILQQSVSSVAQKLNELEELTQETGYPIHSLSVLCRSRKKYERFVDSWKSKTAPQTTS